SQDSVRRVPFDMLERLPMDKHPFVSILACARCVLAVAGCAPAYTKPSAALPSHTNTTDATSGLIHVVHRVAPPSHINPTGVERRVKMVIPLPDPGLLRPQAEPACEFPSSEMNADDRQKLDYERQCYRHAEIIARDRLQVLQNAVDKTIEVVKRRADP